MMPGMREMIEANLGAAPEAPSDAVPMEAPPMMEDMDEQGEDPSIPEMQEPSDEELIDRASRYLQSHGLQVMPQGQMNQAPQAPDPEPDPMDAIHALAQGISPYEGDGSFDEQAAFISAQVAQRAAQQTMQQAMDAMRAEMQQIMAPMQQMAQQVQMGQAEQEVRADLRAQNLDDAAIDATIQRLNDMGPSSLQHYLQNDMVRDTMRGFAISKRQNNRAEKLAMKSQEVPVDALPATKDAGAAIPAKAPSSIREMVSMAKSDPNFGRN